MRDAATVALLEPTAISVSPRISSPRIEIPSRVSPAATIWRDALGAEVQVTVYSMVIEIDQNYKVFII